MARTSLRTSFDRDVYQIIKKLEDANDGRPFKSVSLAYDAIKRSNSSLSRQKKRPLEDALDRVLQFRKEEQADSEDSDAAIEQNEPARPEDDRFLLNRQMIKHWHQDSGAANGNTEPPATKKRRIQSDNEERDDRVSGSDAPVNGVRRKDAQETEKPEVKTAQKKHARSSRFKVEELQDRPTLGGLGEFYYELLEHTRYLLQRPSFYERSRSKRCSGMLISGPSGTGKKSLVRTLAADLHVPLVSLAGCFEDLERMEKSLAEAIDTAMSMAPCIIFIEHLDWYISKSDGSGHSDQHRKVASQLMRQMQRIQHEQTSDNPILAIATTSRITDVDPVVLQTGTFERTFQVRVPDRQAREDIFRVIMREQEPPETIDMKELAKLTHGFVGADILNVVKLAGHYLAKRAMAIEDPDQALKNHVLNRFRGYHSEALPYPEPEQLADTPTPDVEISMDDFKQALKGFTPSLRKEGFTVIPSVTWEQVGALTKVRQQLHRSIIGPIMNPEMYQAFGLKRPAGVLLWGPPGCGKTLVAQAVANEAQASFILINGPELLNKYVGESERAIRELFQRARSSTPCILFFDEMDSLVPRRDNASTESGARVVNAFLTELDGAQDRSGIYVIGTTNRPDMIDEAMLRPGRLSVRLFLDLPTAEERVDILRAIFVTHHDSPSDADLARLQRVALDPRCNDFSGADLGGLHIKAAEFALGRFEVGEKTVREIDDKDWEHALATTTGSVRNPGSYRKLAAKQGS